jgi:hypothetical protein
VARSASTVEQDLALDPAPEDSSVRFGCVAERQNVADRDPQ